MAKTTLTLRLPGHSGTLCGLTLMALTALVLSACALSQAADTSESLAVPESTRVIDWERANNDATASGSTATLQRSSTALAVPLLLPPKSLLLTDTGDASVEFTDPQIITDTRGYSSVSRGERFDILIDASDRTFLTENDNSPMPLEDFDGEFKSFHHGGQISIGRYGALYAVQLLCQVDNQIGCVTERMVREVVEALVVSTALTQ